MANPRPAKGRVFKVSPISQTILSGDTVFMPSPNDTARRIAAERPVHAEREPTAMVRWTVPGWRLSLGYRMESYSVGNAPTAVPAGAARLWAKWFPRSIQIIGTECPGKESPSGKATTEALGRIA